MTVEEFDREFDILYNQILSNTGANIDLYEKSVILTLAQEEIVRGLYSGTTLLNMSFEENERLRRRLNELAIAKSTNYDTTLNTNLDSIKISTNSKFFELDSNVWYIVEESVFNNTNELMVIPITHDTYQRLRLDPFQKPNNRKAWRMDIKNTINSTNVVEIISTLELTKYVYRYLTKPEPIVLTDLDTLFPGENLTIDGVNTSQTCKLNNEIHRIILKRGVEIATEAYKQNSLDYKLNMHTRDN